MVDFIRYMWKNPVELDTPQMTMWNLHIACWMNKGYRHSGYMILLLFHCNNGGINPTCCYIICTLPVLFSIVETIASTTLQKRV